MFFDAGGGSCRHRTLWIFWTLLTGISAAICCGGCLLPFWLHGRINLQDPLNPTPSSNTQIFAVRSDGSLTMKPHQVVSYLGLFRRCGYLGYTRSEVVWRPGCGYYPSLADIPHWSWRLGLVLLALTACLLVFLTFFICCAGLTSPLAFFVQNPKLCRACAAIHLLGGIFSLTACILFPIGWGDNPEILQTCGPSAKTFQLGNCEIGWAFVLTVSGGVVSLVLSAVPHLFTITESPSLYSATPATSHGISIDGLKPRYPKLRDRWSMGQYPLLSVPMDTSAYYFPHNQSHLTSLDHVEEMDGRRLSLRASPLILQTPLDDMTSGSYGYRMEVGAPAHHRLSMTSSCMFSCIPEQPPSSNIPPTSETVINQNNAKTNNINCIDENVVEVKKVILERYDEEGNADQQQNTPKTNGHLGEWVQNTSI